MKKTLLWLWQFPQNICGVVYKLLNKRDIISRINASNPKAQCYLKRSKGGVTLGQYVFVYQNYSDLTTVIKHEMGHVEQSKLLGPLYLIVIGIPSIIHAAIHSWWCGKYTSYYHFYTERWADKIAGIER